MTTIEARYVVPMHRRDVLDVPMIADGELEIVDRLDCTTSRQQLEASVADALPLHLRGGEWSPSAVAGAINGARGTIYVDQMPTHPDVLNALRDAQKRGVAVALGTISV